MAAAYTLQEVTDYYANLLALQYKDKPKAYQTIQILLKQAVADYMGPVLQDAFNLDTAVGLQLDIIGKYVGVNRNQQDVLDIPYFGFVLYAGGGNANGFTLYGGGVNTNGIFYSYADFGVPNTALSDVAYAFVIKMQIILNHSDETLASIQSYLDTFLPGFVSVVDNRDMTLSYTVSESAPVSVGVLINFLPRPMGVGINVTKISDRVTSDGTFRVTSDGSLRAIPVA